MGLETPNLNPAENTRVETPEARAEQYYRESMEIAQKMSKRWEALRKKAETFPLTGKLAEINGMTQTPVSGIQVFFEAQVDLINKSTASNADARSRTMQRLKEELESIEKLLNLEIG